MPVPMFGTGTVTLVPSGSNPTPFRLATLQDISLDPSFAEKELRGENQFPDDIAHGDGKLTGKAKVGKVSGGGFSLLLAGSTQTTGRKLLVRGEAGTIPAPSGPYTIQVSNHSNFEHDEGVMNVTTGLYMLRVASGPATGQYSVDETTGTYTFAAADTGIALKIYYSYADTGGFTTAYTNQLQGTRNTFRLDVFNSYNGKNFGYRLWNVSIPKLALAAKNSDYTMQDLDFSGAADSSGRIIDIYTED